MFNKITISRIKGIINNYLLLPCDAFFRNLRHATDDIYTQNKARPFNAFASNVSGIFYSSFIHSSDQSCNKIINFSTSIFCNITLRFL